MQSGVREGTRKLYNPVLSSVKWANQIGFSTGYFSDMSRAEGSDACQAGPRGVSDASVSLSQQGTLESDIKGQHTGPLTSCPTHSFSP